MQDIVTEPEYLDVTVPAGASFTHAVKPGHTAFAYVFEGKGYFDAAARSVRLRQMFGAGWLDCRPALPFGPETLVLYEREGDDVAIATPKQPRAVPARLRAGPSASRWPGTARSS